MARTARRSWLLVPVSDVRCVDAAPRSDADVVVLDLVEFVHHRHAASARAAAPAAITAVAASGAEVFLQVTPRTAAADLTASVRTGLSGVVVSRADSADEIVEIAELLTELERDRCLPAGSIEIVAALETGRGNSNGFAIATASPRVTAISSGRVDLIMDLRPEPSGEIHLLPYLLQRLVLLARTCGRTPLGAWWRAPARGLYATPDATFHAAVRARWAGTAGTFCVAPEQVAAVNGAFEAATA